MKYFECIISVAVWIITILWFKNSTDETFPYEPAILFLTGLIPLAYSLGRLGVFSRVQVSTRNPKLQPWSCSGGKIDRTHISVELIVENNKEHDLLIRSIEIHAPKRVKSAVGELQDKIRLMDMENVDEDSFLPLNIQGKKSKAIFVELNYDAEGIENYTQAAAVGNLQKVESFNLDVTYTIGMAQKLISVPFSIETSQLFDFVRAKYEECGDHKAVVMLLEKV